MKFSREEYLDLMTFGNAGRGCAGRRMFVELFGRLVGVGEEWAAQGATQDEIDLVAFDWDYVPIVDCGGNAHVRGGWRETAIEETDEYVIKKDSLGRRLKLFKRVSTIPLPLDFPVDGMDSWLKIKPLFEFNEDRIDDDALEQARKAQAAGALVVALMPGGFDMPRTLLGVEKACLAYYDEPELMHDILDTLTDTACRTFERVTDSLVIDQLSVHEDMAGKNGPLLGPDQFERFVGPYYKKVWDLLSARGARLFDMDTDGNVEPLIDQFLDVGLSGLAPNEPAAGMDIVALRKKYGRRLAFKGGIDKFVLKKGKDAIRKELEYKMQPLMQEGGCVFGLDHRIPNGTSIDDYRYYVALGREMLGLPSLDGSGNGWRRMAF